VSGLAEVTQAGTAIAAGMILEKFIIYIFFFIVLRRYS
jgi:hypothetical protein